MKLDGGSLPSAYQPLPDVTLSDLTSVRFVGRGAARSPGALSYTSLPASSAPASTYETKVWIPRVNHETKEWWRPRPNRGTLPPLPRAVLFRTASSCTTAGWGIWLGSKLGELE